MMSPFTSSLQKPAAEPERPAVPEAVRSQVAAQIAAAILRNRNVTDSAYAVGVFHEVLRHLNEAPEKT